MQGKKNLQARLFYQVSLHDLVPQDNYYRQLSQELDLQWLYKATAKFYGSEGNESIDPVVFFKILLVGYLNNIGSDRKLIEFCSDSLAIRLFLRYDIDQPLPWHSTISRTRQLYGEEVFLELFRKVLSLCIEKGMVRGKRQAVDSAYIKANASMDSLAEKEVVEDAQTYADELNEGSDYKVSIAKKKAVDRHHKWKEEAYKTQHGGVNTTGHTNQIDPEVDENGNLIRPKFLSNHTHYSPTDPDAKISTKPGKARQLNYAGQIAVDDAHHVITAACASSAGHRDSQNLHQIVEQAVENLGQNNLLVEQIAADAGYSSGEALQYLEEKGLEGWIPPEASGSASISHTGKALSTTHYTTATNASEQEATKPICLSRASKQAVQATKRRPIAAARPTARAAPFKRNAAGQRPGSRRSMTASTNPTTTGCTSAYRTTWTTPGG